MSRSPVLQECLDDAAKAAFGRTMTESHKQDICVSCGKPATEFKDELSKKDYSISGFCQTCQDETFGG